MEEEVQESLKFDANPLKDVALDQPKAITSSVENFPALQSMDRSIKINANQSLKTTDFYKDFIADNTIANPFQSMVDNRIDMTDYSIDANNAYTRLNSGELTPLYENYIPGTNNEDRLAKQQSTTERWLNGLAKFGTSTLNTVVGGTVGTLYGIGAAVNEGSFNAVFDNDFTQYLDDLNTKMRYELPNYYSQQEKDRAFYKNMLGDGAANFWADKALGAAAFTVGAIVSEGIWAAATGGASLTTTAARMAARGGRVGKWATKVIGKDVTKAALKDYKGWVKKPLFNFYKKGGMLNKDAAIAAARTAEALNTTRFLITSSGYEAGVEALHYKKEAEENFYNSFYELNGRQPTGEEIADFENDLSNSANAVFGGNMALLSVSNAVMFGKLFNVKSPFRGATKEINKKLFGLGIEETAKKGVFKALAPTKKQKLFTGVYSVGKPLATEGLFEEGGQGSLSKAAGYWTESKYNPDYTKNTMSVMEALSEGMAETYGTVEGWEEITLGFIIGGGASMIQGKGKPLDLKQIQEGRENNEDLVNKMNTFAQDVQVQRMMSNNKIQNAVERQTKAEKEGNTVEAELANQDALLAEIEFRHQIGEDVSDIPNTYRIALENMTEEQFKEKGIENKEEYVDSVVSGYTNLVGRYKKNIKYAEAITGIDSQNDNFKTVDTAQAMAYAITVGETSSTIMESALDQMRETIGTDNARALDLKSELERLTKNQRATLSRRVKALQAQKEKQQALTLKIQKVQNAPKETEGDRESGVQLASLNEALLRTNQEVAALESEVVRFGEELSQEKTRRQGIDKNSDLELPVQEFYTLEDLTSIDERIENINTLIDSYQGHNPQLYQELVGLTNQYNQAKESFYRYNAMGNALARGDVKIKNKKMGGLLGKVLAKDQYTQDEFTQAFLSDILAARITASVNTLESETTQENVPLNELYIPVTEERKTLIAEKIRKAEKLSKRESRIYQGNKEDIDNRVSEINKEKGDSPLQKEPEQETSSKNEVDRLKEVVEKELKEYDTLQYIGQDADELVKNRPSNTDIERYRELLKKDRLAEEEIEFDKLQQKLSNWRVLDSLTSGPRSLAEILSLIQQLETQVEQDQTVTEITEEYATQIIDESLGTGSTVVYELTQNTTGNATAKLLKGGVLKLSHIKIDTILSRLGGEVTQKKSKSDTIYTVTPEGTEGTIIITVKPTGAIEIALSDFLSLQQSLNLYIVDSGQINWTYKDIYEVSGQEFVIKESDFIDDDITGNPYDIPTGETIEFFYDAEDSFNKELYKKLEKGKISKEEFRDQVKIFIRKDGKNYGTLKGMREGATDENMLAIRDRATRAAEQGLSVSIGNTQVSQVVLGSPKFILNDVNKPTELPITERATEEVVTTGYIMDNEFTLSDKTLEETTDQSFVGKLSKSQEGKKIPVVVIRKGVHLIAYPISIVKRDSSQYDKLEAILENETITPAQKVKEINDLIIEIGISPSAYNLTDMSEQEKLDRIAEDLSSHKTYTTADTFADSYDKKNLIEDATIKIDLEDLNFSISSPKIRIDLDNISVYETASVKYENITDVENSLSEMSLKVNQLIMSDYVNSKGDTLENKFTDVYAEDAVIKKPANHLEKMHNVRMLLEAFPLITPKFKQLMGQDNYNTVVTNIKKIEFLKKQLDTKTNPEVQNKKDELEC